MSAVMRWKGRLGVPYQGSKNQIAKEIISILPSERCIGNDCPNRADNHCKGGDYPPWSWARWYTEELPKKTATAKANSVNSNINVKENNQ